MSFGHSALRGFPVTGTGGRVEYRLARNAVVSEFHKGRLSKLDVCDAHPELMRAARNVGVPLPEECPICEGPPLVHVTYVFGPGLPTRPNRGGERGRPTGPKKFEDIVGSPIHHPDLARPFRHDVSADQLIGQRSIEKAVPGRLEGFCQRREGR